VTRISLSARLGGAVAAVVLLAACGSTSSTNRHVTLTLLTHVNTPPGTTINDAVAKQFERTHPGVTVRIVTAQSGTELTKLQTLISAGDAPNVFDSESTWMADLIDHGALSPVDYGAAGYKSEQALAGAYLPGVLSGYGSKGTVYGIPTELSDYLAWVNTSAFKQAGVAPPTTWAQVCQDGPRLLRTANGKVTQEEIALPTNLPESQFIAMDAISREFGSPLVNEAGTRSYLTSKSVENAFQMVQDLVYRCHASEPALNSSEEGADRLVYEAGTADIILTGGSWFTGGLTTTYTKLAPPVSRPMNYPAGPDGHANDSYGYADVVPKGAPNQSLSWALAEALASPGLQLFKQEGDFTGAESVSKSSAAKQFPYWTSTWAPALARAHYEQSLLNASQIDDIVGTALDQVIENDADVRSTLASANAQLTPLLNKS
jgi:multiple sugar transport system substrate-binding protein